jgi:hypothetical protein
MAPFIFDPHVEHLLRRAGFGARPDELDTYRQESFTGSVTRLIEYERIPDDVDSKIGKSGYVLTSGGEFNPRSNIGQSRQRWLFRMVHSDRPIQEKMTSSGTTTSRRGTKIQGILGNAAEATLHGAAQRGSGGVRGQIEMPRDNALGIFATFSQTLPKTRRCCSGSTATRTRLRPQENFGREIMELSRWAPVTTEPDVRSRARVHRLNPLPPARAVAGDPTQSYRFIYNANQHDTAPKAFSLGYKDGNNTIPLGRRTTACRTASTSSTSRPIRTPDAIWRRSCIDSSFPRSAM